MNRKRSRTTGRDSRSWQSHVWARIARENLRAWRSGWRRRFESDNVDAQGGTMTDEPRRVPAVRLERSHRAQRALLRKLALVVLLIAGVALGVWLVTRRIDCDDAVRSKHPEAVQVCRNEYQRTQSVKTGVLLAEALYEVSDYPAALQLAGSLLNTTARSDAFYVLGSVHRDEHRNEDAVTALEEAKKLHRVEQRPRELARDNIVLALVRTDRGEFAEALQLIEQCISDAQMADDPYVECRCHLTAAKTLIAAGYLAPAHAELKGAMPTTDRQRSDVEYQWGNLEQELGNHKEAAAKLLKALQLRGQSPDTRWMITTNLNLAYSLADTGNLDRSQEHLTTARLLDADDDHREQRAWTTAQLAYQRQDFSSAATSVEEYFQQVAPNGVDALDDNADLDDPIEVAVLGARIELERNQLAAAEKWAQRGVDMAERVRCRQTVLELRPWVLAKRRAAYELLFTVYARSQQIEKAAMLFDTWQGRAVQDSLATPQPPASAGRRAIADQLTKLGPWLRVASRASCAHRVDRPAVLATVQRIDLIAMIVADGQLWRLEASRGPLRLSKIASLVAIRPLLDKFRAHPAQESSLGAVLGALLLPQSAFRSTTEALHVVVDGRIPGLPVAALRRDGVPLITLRPIVRMLRLPETHCARPAPAGPAVVLGASDSSIPLATHEAKEVAQLLGVTSQTGNAATKAALFDGANAAVMHVAAHGVVGDDGASLKLTDGVVSALEIPFRRIAPKLAVLSACYAAVADDPELAGSLAAGFLAAGSQHVVATLQKITDRGALKIATGFYHAGGVANPPRALADVQASLAETNNTDWPNVVVFGPEICTEDSP